MFFLFILHLSSSTKPSTFSFLQTDYPKEALASGIENLEQTFSDFSYNVDSSLSAIYSQINSLNKFNKEVASSIIETYLKEIELNEYEIMRDIKKIKRILDSDDTCMIENNCEDCLSRVNCVWCSSNNICVKGDTDGPLSYPCDDFYPSFCPKLSCDSYLTCYTCLSDSSCSWCASSLLCVENQYEKTKCDDLEFYFKDASGKDNCPTGSSFSENIQYLPSGTADLLKAKLERLYEKFASCESLILILQDKRDSINSSRVQTAPVTSAGFEATLSGLSETVGSLESQEIQAEQQEEMTYAQDYAFKIVDGSQGVLGSDTDATISTIKDSTSTVSESIKNATLALNSTFSSTNNSIKQIDKLVGIDNDD